MKFTASKSEPQVAMVRQLTHDIKEIAKGLEKYPNVLKAEFVDIYSRSTVKLDSSRSGKADTLTLDELVDLL